MIKKYKDFNESLRDKMIPKDEKEVNDKIDAKLKDFSKISYADIADLWVLANKETRKRIENKFIETETLEIFQGMLRSHYLTQYIDSDLAKTDEWMQ